MLKQIVLAILAGIIFYNTAWGQDKVRPCNLCDTIEAIAYYDSAVICFKNADYLKAKLNFLAALDIYKRLYGEKYQKVPLIYRKISIIESRLGNNNAALNFINQCLEITKELYGEISKETAAAYGNLGITYNNLEIFDKAEYYLTKSQKIYRQLFGENSAWVAAGYNNLGTIYLDKGDCDKAAVFEEKALAIRLKVLPPNHEDLAASYNNLACTFYTKGDYDLSLEYETKGLAIKQNIFGEFHPAIAWSYNNIGCSYFEKADYKKALGYQHKALAIRLKTLGDTHADVAASYTNLGNIYEKLCMYDSALWFQNKSLAIKINKFGMTHSDVASTYFNIGNIYFNELKYDSAIVNYSRSITINKKIFSKPQTQIADYLDHLANAYILSGQINKANECLDSATVYNITGGNDLNAPNSILLRYTVSHSVMMRILLRKADALTYEKNVSKEELQKALSNTQEALVEAEKAKSEITTENSKLYMGVYVYDICDKAINVLYKLYNLTHQTSYIAEAFDFSEKSKASVLYESMTSPKALLQAGIPGNVLQKEKSLQSDIAYYETKRKTTVGDEISIHENIDSVLFALKSTYKKYLDSISDSYPLKSKLMQETKIASIDEIKLNLPPTSAMVEYFEGKEKSFAFVVTSEKSVLIELPVDTSLISKTKKFLTGIRKNNPDMIYENGSWLYQSLLEPLIPSIKGANSIVIVPDQILSNIPFEALITGGNKIAPSYCIEKYTTTYQISASIWQDKSKSLPGKPTLLSFAGFAPVFKSTQQYAAASHRDGFVERYSQDTTFLDTLRGQQYFRELPNSGEEVTQIAALFKKSNQKADTYTFEQASKTAFKNESPKYNILHIATHAYANNDEPELSWMAFANTDSKAKNSSDDGILYAGEIYGLSLHANLVVLSACETGLGKIIKGEGVMSLSRSLMYAGVPNIVLSLWKVGDLDTRLLMVEFYKAYLSGKSYSDALRTAKLSMLKKASGNPKSWAGFVLFGI